MKTKTFIVIVSYNGMEWLSKCLRSCEPYNVIVVDNNSRDGTVAFIQKEFPEITLLQQNSNLGFGLANNIGISFALKNAVEYVFLLNQDAYLDHNTIEELIRVHKTDTSFGVLSPIHLNGEGATWDKNFSNYIVENKKLQYDTLNQVFSKPIYEVPFINAAAWLLPRSTIEKIGGFDPIFFHLGEDINYCQRVLYHKLKTGVVPKAYIRHDREFRLKKKLKTKTEKLAHYERGLKHNWANINIEPQDNIKKKKQGIVKTILKLSIKLKFNDVLFNLDKYFLIKKILPEIRSSRENNKKVGLHYLNV